MGHTKLNPTEVTVLEVVRRCSSAKLGPPTTATIIQLSGCKPNAVRVSLPRLVELGYLTGGGRGGRGYEATEKATSTEEVAA